MQRRHLDHQHYTPAAIDDVIARGRWDDWAALRSAALSDTAVMARTGSVCRPRVVDPYAQRHPFRLNDVHHQRQPPNR